MKRLLFLALFVASSAWAQPYTVQPTEHRFLGGIKTDSISSITSGGSIALKDSDNGSVKLASNCVTHTTDSGTGAETVAAVFPAKVVRVGLTLRVDTILAGASLASITVGDGTDPDLYDPALELAAGSTSDASTLTATPIGWSATALAVVLTAGAGQFDSGVVTVCGHYIVTTAPAN